MTLEETIAKIPLEELRKRYKDELTDWAETDSHVRKKAREVLTEFEVEGDSYGVPPIEDIVDKLVENIKMRETSLKILSEIIE